MKKNKITFLVATVVVIGLLSGTGCASKKYVLGEMASLDQKVEGVESTVEENQKRIKEHDERLSTLGSLITQNQSEMSQQKSELDGKIDEVKRFAEGKLILQEVMRNDEAKAMLDQFVQTLVAQNKGLYLEIQGHTDNTGDEAWNVFLGKLRAEAVMEYLHDTYSIPLHRMEVISYGSAKPIADNATSEGRAQNRRVVILVYE